MRMIWHLEPKPIEPRMNVNTKSPKFLRLLEVVMIRPNRFQKPVKSLWNKKIKTYLGFTQFVLPAVGLQ
jgi:hypothetical protein